MKCKELGDLILLTCSLMDERFFSLSHTCAHATERLEVTASGVLPSGSISFIQLHDCANIG